MREDQAQQRYWDALAPDYRAMTRIDPDDFHYGPRLAGESRLKVLPPLRKGMTALELGCGAAQNSLWLARRGLRCTALDVSAEQMRPAQGKGIELVCAPIERFRNHLRGRRFDLVHSSHAFEFLPNPQAVINRCAQVLNTNGWLLFSTVHPLYNGDWVEAEDGTFGKFLPNYFSPPDDVRSDYGGVTIRSRAWPIEAWFKWIRAAGLRLVDLREPSAAADPAYTSDAWEDDDGEAWRIPSTLILLAQKE